MLNTELDAAFDGLTSLADSSWMMSLPQQQGAFRYGHPAGRERPGPPGLGDGAGLVAVTFGAPLAAPGLSGSLPVQWESLQLGDAFTVLLSGNVALAPGASRGRSTLALAGFCRLLHAADDGNEQARVDLLKDVARSFITSVAVAVASFAEPSHQAQPPGPASSWVNGRA